MTKRALLVERAGGPLIALTPFFKRSQYEVLRAPDAKTVSALVRDVRRLSVVVVNGSSLRSDPASLVRTIKDQHPDLPILWFTEEGTTGVMARPSQKVEHTGNDLAKLEAKIAAIVRDGFYSERFVQHFKVIARNVLTDSHLPTEPSEPCIKSSLTTLSEVNAFVFFNGRRFAGHVVLSSSISDLNRAYCQLFPESRSVGDDDLEDFLGEAANQLVGRLKQSIERDAGDCTIGLPHFIRGQGSGFRYKAGAPSLAIDFTNGSERLQLEVCLYRFDDWALTAKPIDDLTVSGELKFL